MRVVKFAAAAVTGLVLGSMGGCSSNWTQSEQTDQIVDGWAETVCVDAMTKRSALNDNAGESGAAGWEHYYYCSEDSQDGQNDAALLYLYESSEDVEDSLRQLPCDDVDAVRVYGSRWIAFPVDLESPVAKDLIDQGASPC